MTRGRVLSLLFTFALYAVVSLPLAESRAVAGPANGNEETPDAALPSGTDSPADATTAGPCPADMAEVVGTYCPDLDQRCGRWLPVVAGGVERCAEFAPSGPCKGVPTRKHFCIDRYEYPNKHGERPAVMRTWNEAQDLCKASGKRLCGESEWTLACEGKHHLPYPYGRKRSATACNIDHPLLQVDEKALLDPKRSAAEALRLWQGETSGSRPGCASPYGVFDMTGNVDEWVVNESGKPFRSASKGGYWGPVRARCRPSTTAHGEGFPFYQTGFRCCAEPQPVR